MRDFIFKPELNEGGDVDRTKLKVRLAEVLGPRVVDGKTKYLFSAEPLIAEAGEWYRLRILDDREFPGMREIPVREAEKGSEITLSVWLALDRVFNKADGRAMVSTMFGRKAREHCAAKFGQALSDIEISIGSAVRVMSAISGGKASLSRPYAHVAITGKVADADLVEEIKFNGIGQARAYGFGLVASRQISKEA